MGNEALTQALIRLVVIGLTAFIGAIGANLTILQDAVSDPVLASLVFSVATAALSAILKWLGGATTPAPVTHGKGADGDEAATRPNPLAI